MKHCKHALIAPSFGCDRLCSPAPQVKYIDVEVPTVQHREVPVERRVEIPYTVPQFESAQRGGRSLQLCCPAVRNRSAALRGAVTVQ